MIKRSPLRICHLGKFYPPAPGGIETHVQTLARAQAALGADVRVLCVDHLDQGFNSPGTSLKPLRAYEEQDGDVRVIRALRRTSMARLDICPDLPQLIRDVVERDECDVLHLHTPNPTMMLALAMVRPTTPLVITHHSDIIRQKVLRWALRPFERFVYGRAATIQTTSPVYINDSNFLGRYASRVGSLPLGVDLTPFAHPSPAALEHTRHLRQTLQGPLWLAVGRLVYYKALHVAIEALAKLPGTLMIVGHGPLEKDLKDLATRLGVADRIHWRGYVSRDELAGSYRAATALLFPSNARSEAFGLVQVEAMAASCPVVNTTIAGSGVPWVSRHEESGLTVPINDSAALVGACRRLLDEPGLRDRLAIGARRRAASEFDHHTMARRSIEIYRAVIRNDPLLSPAKAPRPASAFRGAADLDLSPVGTASREQDRELAPKHEPEHPMAIAPGSRTMSYSDARVAPLFREPVRGS